MVVFRESAFVEVEVKTQESLVLADWHLFTVMQWEKPLVNFLSVSIFGMVLNAWICLVS